MKRFALVSLLFAVTLPAPAIAADPDPHKFTPPGYEFCGWQNFATGGWEMQWRDDLAGAYLVAFAAGMSCHAARRNVVRMRNSKIRPYRPLRTGYRCRRLATAHEFSDVRCTKIGATAKFRFQTGA